MDLRAKRKGCCTLWAISRYWKGIIPKVWGVIIFKHTISSLCTGRMLYPLLHGRRSWKLWVLHWRTLRMHWCFYCRSSGECIDDVLQWILRHSRMKQYPRSQPGCATVLTLWKQLFYPCIYWRCHLRQLQDHKPVLAWETWWTAVLHGVFGFPTIDLDAWTGGVST